MSNFPRSSAYLTVAVVACSVLAAAGVAHAEDTTAAREHYQKGTAFFDLGKYQEAIKEFEAAYEAKNDPAFLYNLAQAHRLAGNPEQALRFYRTYLRRNPNPPNRADIEDKIKQLEKLVDQKTATQTSPPTQTIQPSLPPATPPWQPAPPAASPEAPAAAPPAAPPPMPGPATTPAPAPIVTMPAPPPPAPVDANSGRGLRIAGWILAGVGVTALIGAAEYGVEAKNAASDIKKAADMNGMYTPALQTTDKNGRSDQTLEFTFLGIGGASLIAGVVCYVMGHHAEASGPTGVALVPSVTRNGASASLGMTF
ncbi:MAG TPA: tetratricopeptide repeat protein [Polyangia bacterium]|jgi:tetratricopeptide (TPR) repeat protein